MTYMKKIASAMMACVFFFGTMAFPMHAKGNDVVVEDVVVTQGEYIKAVAEYEQISYSEAAEEIEKTRNIARVEPESVVTIHRTVMKKVKTIYDLRCSAYLDVVRDNRTGRYIEILAVRAPYVDLSGNSIGATMSGSTSYTIATTKATVYCNGSIIYTVPSNTMSVNFPGISVGTTVSGDKIYRYDVNTTFVFVV